MMLYVKYYNYGSYFFYDFNIWKIIKIVEYCYIVLWGMFEKILRWFFRIKKFLKIIID